MGHHVEDQEELFAPKIQVKTGYLNWADSAEVCCDRDIGNSRRWERTEKFSLIFAEIGRECRTCRKFAPILFIRHFRLVSGELPTWKCHTNAS